MGQFKKVSKFLEFNIEYISAFLMLLILFSVFGQVILRYFFGISHGYMEEFTRWFQIWIAYLMLGVVEKRRKHISINILPQKFSGRPRAVLMSIISIANLLVAVIFVYMGIKLILQLKMVGIVSQTEIPTPAWIVKLCVPIGAALLGFFSLEHLINDIALLTGKSKGGEEDGNA